MYFYENKISWYLVFEDNVFPFVNIVYGWIFLKNSQVIDNEVH
jgi:hypothetical protein